jgi:hypothetical protein
MNGKIPAGKEKAFMDKSIFINVINAEQRKGIEND